MVTVINRNLFRRAVDRFCSELCRVTGRSDVNYKCNEADINAWNSWCGKYGIHHTGEDIVNKWIDFGLESWFNERTQSDYGYTVRFSWLFGKKAVQRWEAVNSVVRVSAIRRIKKSKKSPACEKKRFSSDLMAAVCSVRPYEEQHKQKYINTKRGLLWCVANTTLYNHKSELCLRCENKQVCKQTLKEQYPSLYEKRGYS